MIQLRPDAARMNQLLIKKQFSFFPGFRIIYFYFLRTLAPINIIASSKSLLLCSLLEQRFQSLGQEELPGEEMAAPSSLPVWKISWTEEPGGLQSMRPQSWRQLSTHTVLKSETRGWGRRQACSWPQPQWGPSPQTEELCARCQH